MSKYLAFPLLFLLTSCITVLPAAKTDDGTASLTDKDKAAIAAFDPTHVNKLSFAKKTDMRFEYISATDIKQLFEKNNYDCIVVDVWATWCSHCFMTLSNFSPLQDALKKRNGCLLVVSQNINVPAMQKMLFDAKYRQLAYIIDPASYGTDETQKQVKFLQELTGSNEVTAPGSVPKTVVLTKNGRVKIISGESRTQDVLFAIDSISGVTKK